MFITTKKIKLADYIVWIGFCEDNAIALFSFERSTKR